MSKFTVAVIDDAEVPLRWGLDELRGHGAEVIVRGCRTEAEVIETAAEADVVVMVIAPITAHVLENLPKCRAVLKSGVGVDTIDLDAAAAKGIAVGNVGNYCAEDVAEHALALAVALVRKLPQGDGQVREGTYDRTLVAPVHRISAHTLGVVGLGAIGSALARRWRALGGRVLAYDPYLQASADAELAELDDVLRESTIVSLHVPLTPETRGIIGARELALLPPGAFVINASRGETLDNAALLEALRSGHVAGAGLDVWDPEPIPQGDPVLTAPNVLLTAHYAGYSEESFDDLRRRVVDQVLQVRDGALPRFTLNGVERLRDPVPTVR
jgi:D-3-phosphoglycerate dehydrogenase